VLPIWRAPGGIVTREALRMAAACGLAHQGWTANGFLGDELPSDAHPNAQLLRRNLANIRDGEVLVMHWGVRSRREPFAGIFEPLVTGLLARGSRIAEQLDRATRDGIALAPETVAGIGEAEARRNRGTTLALWAIAVLLLLHLLG